MNFDGTIWGKYDTKPWKFLEKMGRSSIKSTLHRGCWWENHRLEYLIYILNIYWKIWLNHWGDQEIKGRMVHPRKMGWWPRVWLTEFSGMSINSVTVITSIEHLLKKIGRSPTVIRVFETMSWEPDHQRRQRASGYEKVGREESSRCSRRTFKPRHSKGADYGPTAGWSENCQRAIPKNFFPEVPKCNSQNLLETWCWWTRLSFSIFFPIQFSWLFPLWALRAQPLPPKKGRDFTTSHICIAACLRRIAMSLPAVVKCGLHRRDQVGLMGRHDPACIFVVVCWYRVYVWFNYMMFMYIPFSFSHRTGHSKYCPSGSFLLESCSCSEVRCGDKAAASTKVIWWQWCWKDSLALHHFAVFSLLFHLVILKKAVAYHISSHQKGTGINLKINNPRNYSTWYYQKVVVNFIPKR